jgi:hypothetical protein
MLEKLHNNNRIPGTESYDSGFLILPTTILTPYFGIYRLKQKFVAHEIKQHVVWFTMSSHDLSLPFITSRFVSIGSGRKWSQSKPGDSSEFTERGSNELPWSSLRTVGNLTHLTINMAQFKETTAASAIYMYVCVYIYIYKHIHNTYIYIHTYTHTHTTNSMESSP